MGEADDEKRRAAHGHTAPHRTHEHVPVKQRPCHNGHNHNVVGEGPKQIYTNEKIAPAHETHQRQNFVQILGKHNCVSGVDVEL